jgi:molecular chaperone Hsp33
MDTILRLIEKKGAFRAFVADTTELVNKAVKIHGLSPVAAAAMGRTLTASAMMGLDLKSEAESLSIQIDGDGPLGNLVTVANCHGEVRGYLDNPVVDLPLKNNKLDVSAAIGNGFLTIINYTGMKEPYIGRVELQTGEIAEDIAYYFMNSQQTPSVVALGVLVDRDYTVKAAGGFIIQLLPGADEEMIQKLEANVYTLESVTEMLSRGLTIEGMAREIFLGIDYDILLSVHPEYKCNCSRERMEKNLISLGKQELQSIIEEQGKAQLSCHFCRQTYDFNKAQLEEILEQAKGSVK